MYKSTHQAIRAAFTPATPLYGSGTLADWTGGDQKRSSEALSAMDRCAQSCLVFCLLQRSLTASELEALGAQFIPSVSDELVAWKQQLLRDCAVRLAAALEVNEHLAFDVVLRAAACEPIGSFRHDWPRWLGVSYSTIYRQVREIRTLYYQNMDRIICKVDAVFQCRGLVDLDISDTPA